ncbi:MAG TPA: TIM-barrel domain-containing protein [Granulicella sp.]
MTKCARQVLGAVLAMPLCFCLTVTPQMRGQASVSTAQGARLASNGNAVEFYVPGYKAGRNGTAGPSLLVHNLSFEGETISPNKLTIRQLSAGVYELTGTAPKVGNWQFEIDDSADGYYGLGERFNELNHTHAIIKNSSQDNAIAKGSGTYKPIPFYMSTTGYGLWLDTTAEATFDMNDTLRENIRITVPGEKLRLVLIQGPEFPTILDRFTALAGRSMLPPYWSFAPWVGRDYHRNDADVKEDIEKTRALGLPASVELIDSPWSTGYNSYVFNPKQFSDITGTIKEVHSEGFKLVLWHTSWINNQTKTPGEKGFADKLDVESSNYKEAAQNGYFVKGADGKPYDGSWWKGRGSLIDFTNPKAKEWWEGQVGKVVALGADGFKDDDAEGNFQGEAHFADGSDPRLMRNRYAVLYNNAMEEVIQKQLKGNGILFARSATVGNHNLAMLWGGDNEASFSPENGLPTVVTAGLNAGMSGMPLWTADLGGYLATSSTPDPRLFMRWTEYAAFSPVMEILSTSNLGPWGYGDEALKNYRKYAVLHMSLFPYRYAAAQEAAKTGMPIMRSLVLNYQNDQQARESKSEYLFGPDLLVAPVIDENTSRAVYLPAGEWVDYWTGKPHAGGTVISAEAPLDVLPLYARANAIIPKIPEDVMTLVPAKESGNTSIKSLDNRRIYELLPAAGSTASTTITDFEGRTLTRTASQLTLQGSAAHVILRWRFGHASTVTVNNASVPVQTGSDGPFVEFDHTSQSTISWK